MIKRMKYSDYILYFLGTIFLVFVPMILYLLKVTNILWPSLSAACLSLVTIIGMIVFGDRQTKDEIKKISYLKCILLKDTFLLYFID